MASGGRAGAERARVVLDELADLVARLPVPETFRELLATHLGEGRAQAAGGGLPAVELPLLVHGALSGREEPALPLAGACTLVYLGADLLDNLADRELPERWRRRSPAEATLAGAALLAPLVQAALDRLDGGAPPARIGRVRRAFTQGLLTMAAGQHDDLLLSGRALVTPAQARLVAERKSGAEVRLFAEAAAALATDDGGAVERLAAFGLALGTAGQIASDLADLCAGEGSHDLAEGKRTLPVACGLVRAEGTARRRLLAMLRAAREDPEARREAVAALAAAGGLAHGLVVVEIYRRRALREIQALPGLRPGAVRELLRLVEGVLPELPGRPARPLAAAAR